MDPDQTNEPTEQYQWIPCENCGGVGIKIKPIRCLRSRPIYEQKSYTCVHCSEEQQSLNNQSQIEEENGSGTFSTQSEVQSLVDLAPFHEEDYLPENVPPIQETDELEIQPSPLPKGYKFMHININGVRAKFDELKLLLLSDNKIAVTIVSESRLSDTRDTYTNMYAIDGYSMIREDRRGKEGGGMLMYINNSMEKEPIEFETVLPEYVEVNVVKIRTNGIAPILVAGTYIPPQCVNENTINCLQNLMSELNKQNCEMMLLGDFNINEKKNDANSRKLKFMMQEFNLYQIVQSPTRICTNREGRTTSTLIDHIYVTKKELYHAGIMKCTGSDHMLIYAVRKKMKMKSNSALISYRAYKNIDKEKFMERLGGIKWQFLPKDDPTKALYQFETVILAYLVADAPLKERHVKHKRQPWFSEIVQDACKNRDKQWKIYESTKSNHPSKWLEYLEYKKQRNKVKHLVLASKKEYFRSKFQKCRLSEDVWNTMNELTHFRKKSASKVVKLQDNTNEIFAEDDSICERFANEFRVTNSQSELATIQNELEEYEQNFYDANPDFEECEVMAGDITKAITYVDGGYQNETAVPIRIYKDYPILLTAPLLLILNSIFNLCSIPQRLKSAICIPLYKGKGKFLNASSYRPIFCLEFIAKIFEKILYDRILGMVEDKLIPNQHGFRRKRSCVTATAYFTQCIRKIIDEQNGKALAIYVDFTRAFDTIKHVTLIRKLISNFGMAIAPKIVKLIANYYTDRLFKVKNGNFVSKPYYISSGSGAGTLLGALIYSLYINDICEAMPLDFFVLYADDLVFFADASNPKKGLEKINECYNKLQEYCVKNDLVINSSKTKAMYFHKARDTSSKDVFKDSLKLDNCTIEIVKEFKYLGLYTDNTLTYDKHYEVVEAKLSSAIGRINSLRRFVTPNILKSFVSCYVMSIVDYCIVIWAIQSDEKIARLQRKIIRFLRSYYYSTSSNKKQVYASDNDLMEWTTLMYITERRKMALIKFVATTLRSKIFDWFKKSAVSAASSDDEDVQVFRLAVSTDRSKQMNNSVKNCAIKQWNEMFQLIKPDKDCALGTFVKKCEEKLLENRNNDFVT